MPRGELLKALFQQLLEQFGPMLKDLLLELITEWLKGLTPAEKQQITEALQADAE